MQKYRQLGGIPVFVQLSGNWFRRSHSTGVSTRYRPVAGSLMKCLNRLGVVPPSLVMRVREGRSMGSGNGIAPSVYR